ncbi:hypothetical protein [Polaromonas sp. UC242_47]|uniref:hypothetical protein n=1 Tax=Polaromonas sp. UC242_47 TaxID=3374626 RepID=UPI0037A4BBA3
MKKAFIDASGVLTAWGYVDSNGTDLPVDVPDDFLLEPGRWQLVEGEWAELISLVDAAKAAAQAAIDSHYQALFDQAVPNSALKAEYDAAYMVAKRWLENQAEPAPERVKALAESYGVTNEQAANVVVQKWTEAQAVAFDLRGAARLRAKLAIRQAVDAEGVAAAELAGRAAMEAVVYTV